MLLLTAEEMRLLDRATIETGHATGVELMERAGAGVVEAMERRYGSLLGHRVLVLCGTGNNGGDGLVAARWLRARGAEVHVGLLGDAARVQGDTLHQLARLTEEGQTVQRVASEADLERLLAARDQWDCALDALLGTGARGAPEGIVAAGVQALRRLDDGGTRVVAVDLPTGVNADTGEIARRAVRADLTVTFGEPKRGHFLYPGRAFAGALEVVDIGLARDALDLAATPVHLATAGAMAALLPARDPRAHKTSVGRVLMVGGSVGLTGALALAARAATRAGAGYVQAALPSSVNDVLAVKLTEQMTIPLPETAERTLSMAALEPLLARVASADAVGLGSGLSRHREAAELARRVAAESERPLVLDADGLNAFQGHTDAIARGRAERVLTPHLGEMERLTGIEPAALEARRIDAAREWAQRWRCVLVLKGAPTVTAAADGGATVNPTGNPGLATAGTGDVLTGVIAALLAQGLRPYDAARLGVYVHGMAGDIAAGEKGQQGMNASDVLESLPSALLALARLRAESFEAPAARTRPADVRASTG
jgi:ADP-dependent NAD(P)H-hydrate dehydratase / NAD(P)H-hydrate epimerase